MSVTKADNPVSTAVLEVLADYDLHHSGQSQIPGSVAAPNLRAPSPDQQPSWWPNDHRRIPPYRPADRHQDPATRPGGTNPVEMAFIFTMLQGVRLHANIARLFRNVDYFKYKIGGEW